MGAMVVVVLVVSVVFVRVLAETGVAAAGTEASWIIALTEGVLLMGWIVAAGGLVVRVVTSVAAGCWCHRPFG